MQPTSGNCLRVTRSHRTNSCRESTGVQAATLQGLATGHVLVIFNMLYFQNNLSALLKIKLKNNCRVSMTQTSYITDTGFILAQTFSLFQPGTPMFNHIKLLVLLLLNKHMFVFLL